MPYTKKEQAAVDAFHAAPWDNDTKEARAMDAAFRKNAKQRSLRVSPAGREAAARASRRSYWKKRKCYGHAPAPEVECSYCNDLKKAHDL